MDLFVKALRLETGIFGAIYQEDGNGLAILSPANCALLTVTCQPDYIPLSYSGTLYHGSSYIGYVPSAEGTKLRIKNHAELMDAYHAARYLVRQVIMDEMP